jgi:Coenzyme PQQ synthesis protein D (PqqD)
MATSLSARSIIVASPDQVSCPLGEESAILNLSNTIYYGLNPVGSRIWRLIQKPKSIGELRDALVDEYEVEPERCESDLLELLEKMRAEGLIEVSSSAAAG